MVSESDVSKRASFCPTLRIGVLFVLGGSLCIATTYILCNYDAILRAYVDKNLVLEANNEFFEVWKNPPLSLQLKSYLFTINNPHQFPWTRVKPNVTQLGPYVFRETWLRTDFKWYANNTLSYSKIRTFVFDEDASAGSLDDIVTTINVPLLATASRLNTASPWMKLLATPMLLLMHQTIFIQKSVRELLFDGFEDSILNLAKNVLHTSNFERFGYLLGRNQSEEERFTIYSGRGDTNGKIGAIDRVNEENRMKVWDGEFCNRIEGTDGSTFSPIFDSKEDLRMFHPYIFRSVSLNYVNRDEIYGMPVNKYKFSSENFDNGSLYPSNECFCLQTHCLKSGTLYMGSSYYGLPFYASLPHFLDTDASYVEAIDGMEPDEHHHSSYAYVEPIAGVPLNVSAKLQLNYHLERIPNFGLFDRMSSMLFPLMWFEESGHVPDDLLDVYWHHVFVPIRLATCALYLMLVFSVLAFVTSIGLFAQRRHSNKLQGYNRPPEI